MGAIRIEPQRPLRDGVYRASDAAAIGVTFLLAELLTGRVVQPQEGMVVAVALVAFYLSAGLSGLYRNWRAAPAEREFLCAGGSWAGALVILLVLGFLTHLTSHYSRALLITWSSLTPLVMFSFRGGVRFVQRQLRARGLNTRGFAVVGVTPLGLRLARDIEQAPELGLRHVGFYDDRGPERTASIPGDLRGRVGGLEALVEAARRGEVSMVFITFPMRAEQRIRSVLDALSDTTASVYLVPDFFVYELLHSRWTNIGGVPVVSVFENPLYGVDGVLKRLLDLVLSLLLLAFLALPMLLIALLIKWTSPGPVLFRQRRYGLDGREILVWKFRSMRVCEEGGQVRQATRDDDRVTPIGRILRRWSLDELPQLFNVLSGTMSLVGPRPHPNALNEQFRRRIQGYMLRHKVKPGITGLAQVSGWRGETETLEKMARRIECDHRYIREWSLWLDVRILLQTVLIVLSRRNAY